MNRGVYSTATSMIAGQRWMDVISNNLANASTTGFKRDSMLFTDTMVREMELGGNRLGQMGAGPTTQATFTVFDRGPIQETKNPLDVAIAGDKGLFGVQTPNGVRYTRDGSLTLDPQRRLTTKQGHPVLDERGQTITVPQGQFQILSNGAIEVEGNEVARIGLFDGAFRKAGGDLFEGTNPRLMTDVRLEPGAVEGSNVNAIESMVQMITLSRSFEMAQRSITQQDDLTQRLIQSLQER